MQKKYRPCAGAVVFNKDGNVLLGSRIDTSTDDWQFPQGGINKNETPAQAAKRELFEEMNISSVKLVYIDKEQLLEQLGITTPTGIQEQVIPLIAPIYGTTTNPKGFK